MRYKCIRQLPFCDVGDYVEIAYAGPWIYVRKEGIKIGEWGRRWGSLDDWFTPVGEIEEKEEIEELDSIWNMDDVVDKVNELVRAVNELKK